MHEKWASELILKPIFYDPVSGKDCACIYCLCPCTNYELYAILIYVCIFGNMIFFTVRVSRPNGDYNKPQGQRGGAPTVRYGGKLAEAENGFPHRPTAFC